MEPFIIVMTDLYSKLTQIIPCAKVTVPIAAKYFLEHWIVSYRIPIMIRASHYTNVPL